MSKKQIEEQLLIKVTEDGVVEVYWHDPEMSGAVEPKISIVYDSDRNFDNRDVQKYIKDFDEVLEDDCTYSIL